MNEGTKSSVISEQRIGGFSVQVSVFGFQS
jgi:hypothetical protein